MVELLHGADASLCLHSFHSETIINREDCVALVVKHFEPRQIFLVASFSSFESSSEDKNNGRLRIAVQRSLAPRRGDIFIKE